MKTKHKEQTCVECGSLYIPYHTTISKYCSKLCQWRNRKRHFREAHPSTEQQKSQHREYNHKYYKRKGEEVRNQAREWYWNNRDKATSRMKQWNKDNPDRVKFHQVKRRVSKMGKETTAGLTTREWQALIWAYGGKCAYCGCTPDEITQDHVIPLAKGGTHTDDNVVPACRPCNQSKGTKNVDDFVYEVAGRGGRRR